ncbi:hypothetical protein DA801_03160 [Lacticaseibacillus rhamnosus]|uniref:Uncharacterized protein n=1 Tax=Lacticaseibacillus rhamnosus TaxID=47715 RepID=A0AAP8J2T6_LACRH|nr:hypothetical protein CYJ91_01865 [Lacticaseibacillus rhamnosus]PTM26102.1 hypothetical protein DA801_03160 [Lacticaseibacillus rhamnosus]
MSLSNAQTFSPNHLVSRSLHADFCAGERFYEQHRPKRVTSTTLPDHPRLNHHPTSTTPIKVMPLNNRHNVHKKLN